MTTETPEKLNVNINVEDTGPCLKTLKIEVPAETVDEKLKDSLDLLATEVELPGFRKGRAPRRLVEKRLGDAVGSEAKKQLVAAAYQQAIEEHELKVIGEPSSEGLEKAELEAGKPLSFEVEVEVTPEFEMPAVEGLKIRKPIAEVPDDIVEQEVEKILVNEGSLEEQETPEPGDYLTGHGVMVAGDETIHDIEGAVIQIPKKDADGKGMILGVMVDDFTKQVGTPKPGDTVTVATKGPDNHEIEAVRGADLKITFEVQRADRIIPAEMNDVVTKFGLDDADQLTSIVKERLNQRALVQQQAVMRQQVARHFNDSTEFDLPKRLTANQAARNLERMRMEMMYRGVDAGMIEQRLAEARPDSDENAARELKLFFILNKAAEDLDVKVEEAEINNRIVQMAIERGERPEKLRQTMIDQKQVPALYQQIREHKTMDAIIAKAEIEEMPADEFNDIMRKEFGTEEG